MSVVRMREQQLDCGVDLRRKKLRLIHLLGGGFANASPYRPVGHGHKRAAGRGKGACRVRKIQCMGFGPVNEFAGRAWPCGHGEDDCSFGCGGVGEPKELAVTSL